MYSNQIGTLDAQFPSFMMGVVGVLVNFYLFNTSEIETQTQKLRRKLYCESFVMTVNRPVSPASVVA